MSRRMLFRSPWIRAGLVLLAAIVAADPAWGQTPGLLGQDPASEGSESPETETTWPTREEIESWRGDLAVDLRALEQQDPSPALSARLSHLRRLDRLARQQLETLRRHEELLAQSEEEIPDDPASYFEHEPPYGLRELDSALDELARLTEDMALLEDTVDAARSAVDTAEREYEEAQRAYRLAQNDLADSAGDPVAEQRLVRELERAVELSREELELHRLELRNTTLQLSNHQEACERARQLVDWVRPKVVPASDELATILAELESRAEALRDRLEGAEAAAREDEETWRRAEQQLMSQGADEALGALDGARRLEQDLIHRRRTLLTEQADRLDQLRDAWELRFAVWSDAVEPGELDERVDSLETTVGGLEREERLARRQLEEANRDLARIRERRIALDGEKGIEPWLADQETSAEALVELLREQLSNIEEALEIHRRLLDEVRNRIERFDFEENLTRWLERVRQTWDYELTEVDGQPITLGKALVALLVLLLGYFLTKHLTTRLGRALNTRMRLESGIANAYQTLAFYTAMVLVFLFALRLVNIPLTVFTVLGGVVAIGVGFGSQNIVNNFISGLILLTERPIKVGDLVEVGGLMGMVESIGLRSARIRSGDNTHIIVPNSSFLENNVLNWTMSDNVLRMQLDVGVAYGSDVEEVERLLAQAMAEEPKVLETPPGEVLFTDFGADALVFRVLFWMRVLRPLDRHRVASALRFRIDSLFADHGVVIAFPQRDVHLDTASPLSVRLLRKDGDD